MVGFTGVDIDGQVTVLLQMSVAVAGPKNGFCLLFPGQPQVFHNGLRGTRIAERDDQRIRVGVFDGKFL